MSLTNRDQVREERARYKHFCERAISVWLTEREDLGLELDEYTRDYHESQIKTWKVLMDLGNGRYERTKKIQDIGIYS